MQTLIVQLQREVFPAKLMVVTKGRSAEEVFEAVQAGAKILGENRVQEIVEKYTPKLMELIVSSGAEIHFIGKLQSNKVKALLPYVHTIHSVDSLKLAEKINKEAKAVERVIPIYIEINATREPQKSGFQPEELQLAMVSIRELKSVTVMGIMCMGKKDAPEDTRKSFQLCRTLANEFKLEGCSMGMSEDYPIALSEGSTMVRIGSKVFEK